MLGVTQNTGITRLAAEAPATGHRRGLPPNRRFYYYDIQRRSKDWLSDPFSLLHSATARGGATKDAKILGDARCCCCC